MQDLYFNSIADGGPESLFLLTSEELFVLDEDLAEAR